MSIETEAEKVYAEVGAVARAIVVKRVGITAGIGAAVAAYVAICSQLNVDIPVGLTDKAATYVAVAFQVLAIVVGTLWAKSGVTPADPNLVPISSNGKKLIEDAGDLVASVKAALGQNITVTSDHPTVPLPNPEITGTPTVVTEGA